MRALLGSVVAWMLFYSCANVGNPSGGPRDETPPKLLRAIPDNGSVNFSGPYITMVFDEFIQLKNPQKNIVVSPRLEEQINYEAKRKTLQIKLPDTLSPNTTYTINFGNALVDLNESNPTPNLLYVFSTGPILDSLTLKGRVVDYRTGKPLAGTTVALYDELNDTMVTSGRPYYLRTTSESGNFEFEYLKSGAFKLAAFDDQNSNLKYDEGQERIAFLESPIILPTDSIFTLYATKPYPSNQRITNLSRSNQAQVNGGLARPLTDNDTLLFSLPVHHLQFPSTKDSFTCWLDSVTTQKLDVFLLRENDTISKRTLFGTIPKTVEEFYSSSPSISKAKEASIGKPGQINLNSSSPVAYTDMTKISLIQDSFPVPDSLYTVTADQNVVSIHPSDPQPGNYQIQIHPGFITDTYGRSNDSVTLNVQVLGPESFGSLLLRCTTLSPRPFKLHLYAQNTQNPIYSADFQGDTTISISNVRPGSYEIKAYIDTDHNGYWSPGYYPGQFPEVYYIHPEALTVRPNWELSVDILLPRPQNGH